SRVGGAAQVKATKQVAGSLRLDLAQFREMAAFAQFGSDLDASTQKLIHRGERLMELLKQPQYQPMSMAEQAVVLFAGTRGLLDEVPVKKVPVVERGIVEYMNAQQKVILETITQEEKLTKEMEENLTSVLTRFIAKFSDHAGADTHLTADEIEMAQNLMHTSA
ncbi:MAG: hypothetical protein HQM01_14840, partial [Magnetococcales bacterium]|nr:hypothetical protein [Magnetococcales bacterium]